MRISDWSSDVCSADLEPRRGRDIGEVRYPKHVPRWRVEPAVDVIGRARCRLVADGRTHRLASDHACQAHLAHQPFNRTAGDLKAFPHHLPPNPAHPEHRSEEHTSELQSLMRI